MNLSPTHFFYILASSPDNLIAHLKLDTEIGVAANQRLRVFLTNSLEEFNQETGTLFGYYLAQEANEASAIKKDAPVMIVMGNPPYSGISQNNGEWITNLLADYKKEPGGVLPLKERKIWLNDDYCKFIRLGQHYVDRNKEGILAYICNNGFLDNPTFRGMRWHLLQSFDKIYIINLHGNSMKRETAPDGSKEENVFDIMVGTSINICVKTGKKKKGELAEVYYSDQYGLRKIKYEYLSQHSLANIEFNKLAIKEPFYFFVLKNEEGKEEYDKEFRVDNLMPMNVTGIVSARDRLVVDISKSDLLKRIQYFSDPNNSDNDVRASIFGYKKDGKYLAGDSRGWSLATARKQIQNYNHIEKIIPISYRPLDKQYVYYSSDMVDWGREKLFYHLINKDNFGLSFVRQAITDNWSHVFIADTLIDNRFQYSNKSTAYICPLYLYPEDGSFDTERIPNLDATIWAQINAAIGKSASPEDIFDYIYGVLHSPTYRTKYKEFLKVDFPRIPYPASAEEFEHFRSHGNRLRELHLMHAVPESPVTFPYPGTMQVEQISVEKHPSLQGGDGGRLNIYINSTQCFEGVPTAAFEMYIGGYQPAQKWLKDRKGRTLTFDDIEHYRRIIAILLETDKIMKQLDNNKITK